MKNILISLLLFGSITFLSFNTNIAVQAAAQSQEDFLNQYLQQKQKQEASQQQVQQQQQQAQDEKTKQASAQLQQTLGKVYSLGKVAFFILCITVFFLWIAMVLLIAALVKYLRSARVHSDRRGAI